MKKLSSNLLKLKGCYGIEATPLGEPEIFDLSSVRVYQSYPDNFTIKNYGTFTLQRFEADERTRYNLIVCPDDFLNNENLVNAMKDSEDTPIKSYELIKAIRPLAGHFLFKLIPYTVQGKPQWS